VKVSSNLYEETKGREQLNKNMTTAENVSFSGKSCFEPGISEDLTLNYEIG
jgi:hypothetical protein